MPYTVDTRTYQPLTFTQKTPIESGVSDHNILIYGSNLSWNIMMQGRWSKDKSRYNNGFGKQENQPAYQKRIENVVRALAECIHMNPHIHTIALQEAPIQDEDIECFITQARQYPCLGHFTASMHSHAFSPMGIATFFDTETMDVTRTNTPPSLSELQDRVQHYRCKIKGHTQSPEYHVRNVHMPYDLAKSESRQKLIDMMSRWLKRLQSNIILGDFNIHPHILYQSLAAISAHTKEANNLLCKANALGEVESVTHDTVDAILWKSQIQPSNHRFRNGSEHTVLRTSLTYHTSLFANSSGTTGHDDTIKKPDIGTTKSAGMVLA